MTQSNGLRTPAKLFAIASLLILTACQTTMGSVVTSQDSIRVACQSFNPIRWSKQDTPLTIAQVREANAAWQALCGKK
jgi:uncharacterized lipoprotein YajG